MSGYFNAAGFSAKQVKTLVSKVCTTSVSGFASQTAENGLQQYSATCSAWKIDARYVEFERMSGAEVLIEIMGANKGNIVYDKMSVNL